MAAGQTGGDTNVHWGPEALVPYCRLLGGAPLCHPTPSAVRRGSHS